MGTMYALIEVCPTSQSGFGDECMKLEVECSHGEGKTFFKMKAKSMKMCL